MKKKTLVEDLCIFSFWGQIVQANVALDQIIAKKNGQRQMKVDSLRFQNISLLVPKAQDLKEKTANKVNYEDLAYNPVLINE